MKSCILIVLVVLSIVTAGCSDKIDTENAKKSGAVAKIDTENAKKNESVVQIDNAKITVEDFINFIKSKPMQQTGKPSSQLIEKYLDDMVTEEVLYQKAIQMKIDQDPQMKSIIRRMLSQKLMEEQVRNKLWKSDIEEKVLQEYYNKYRDQFNRPEQLRLEDIFIAIAPDASEKTKAGFKKKAESVLAEAKQEIQKRKSLMPLVQKYSDIPNKYPKGSTGFFDIKGNPFGIDKNLAGEAFKLEKVGDLADHVVETPDGFHIIMLAGKMPAVSKSLENVKDFLKQKIRQEEFSKLSKEYIEGLKRNAKIQIDQQKVAEVMKNIEGLRGQSQRPTLPAGFAAPPTGHDLPLNPPPVRMAPPIVTKGFTGPAEQTKKIPPVSGDTPK